MIAVWYDPDCDQIWISGEERSFEPRTLVSFIDSVTGRVGIRPKTWPGGAVVLTPFDNLSDQTGNGFGSADEAKVYLDGVFSRERSIDIPTVQAMAGLDLPAGMPVAVSRGQGSLQAARADTYALAFVAGLAPASIRSGFVGQATRNALTLVDWSAAAGTASLAVGQPYFLGASGGLTLTPDRTPGLCLVRIGNATGTQTLAPVQSDPILL